MKLKLKRKIAVPILVLMIMPTMILSILFFNNMQKNSYENANQNIENSFNAISVAISQTNDEFYSRQILFSSLSALSNFGIVVYEGNEVVYEKIEGLNLDVDKIHSDYVESRRYEIKRRTYENLNISVYIIIDKFQLFLKVLNVNKPYLILIAVSIIISLKTILFMIENFSKPIGIFLEGYNNIISGNFQRDINIKREDELGLLGQAFNEMKNQISIRTNRFLQMKRFNEDILRSISTGIITADMHGKIKNYNDGAAQIIDRVMGLNEKNPQIIKKLMLQLNETTKRVETINRVQHFYESDKKESIYLDITTSLMKDVSGEYIGVLCSLSDITSRKKIEESVERINRLTSLGQLTAALAHEIRNPLSGIKMSAQILNKRLMEHVKPREQNLFQAIIGEIERLDILITDLLNFSKPRIPKLQIVNVVNILEKSLLFSDTKAEEKEAEISVTYNIEDRSVYFDKGQLSQIFLNIISNALNAIDVGGALKITVDSSKGKEDKFILVLFEDNGCGIKRENLDKIFDPFFTTGESGTGLGLSVVHKLIVSNHGDIEVQSREGIGTIIKTYLPKYRGNVNENKNSCD
ncbi:PAS domain S-box-containing protein [Anaerovirgula multivorans]|uniref:histidine kinase n=1 Tax=Anaerovirgula multivorans TaxID=312168 RepID=A0A239HM11_9FIRM|nr:ATP-binding protein [Anaerovirgula multivorans]SNS81883.1 PAS domain S-box-containing protein [Anaerovirgula multivorans]